MKTKRIPAMVMLVGGSVTCIVTYLNRYNLEDMLYALIISLIVFYILGLVIEYLFEKYEIGKEEEEETEALDGEIVDKTEEQLEEGEVLELEQAEDTTDV